jgi:hypothetical protein
MSKKENNNSWLLLLLIPLFAFRKKGNSVIVDNPIPQPAPGSPAVVQIAQGAKLYNMNFVQIGIAATTQHWDQVQSNTLPTWIKVKSPLGQTFYVHAGDYKIMPNR